jgi:hypothetical protein
MPGRLEALKRGVSEMKRRSQVNRDDPRGWLFQANIHGTLDGNAQPSWNQCRHASSHFLSWHRAYVYYFERILRDAAGDPELTLPYWDWTDPAAQALPAAFIDSQSPLFEPRREMNQAGSTLVPSIRAAAVQALNLRSFFPGGGNSGFGVASVQGTGKGRIEQPPHDGVHVLVGGDDGLMADPRTAAQDPIFWLHHCNVDRLWEVWLRKGGGRANPTTNEWLDETFGRLFDESGNAPAFKVSQLEKTTDLGYSYDRLTDPPGAAAALASGADVVAEPVKTEVAATVEKTKVTAAPKSVELSGDKVKEITSKAGVTSATGEEKKILLRLRGVSVDRPTGSIYEVYLNLPSAPENASSTSPHFIGVVTLFGSAPTGKALRADTQGHHAAAGAAGEEFLFDVTKVLRILARQSVDLSKLNVTLLPRGSLIEGKPRKVETKATVSIDKITLETAEPPR